MKSLKKICKLTGRIIFALMLSVCLVMGVAPVLPKRKESFAIEVQAEETEEEEDYTVFYKDGVDA